MNLVEIAILLILAAAVFFAVRHLYRNRKNGSCSCSCTCSCGCASCGMNCRKKK